MKIRYLMILGVAALLLLASCAREEKAQMKDGVYFAQSESYPPSGWKSVLTFEIADGKFVNVSWTGAHRTAGPDKYSYSRDGNYRMVELGGSIAEWHEQADLVHAHLLSTQNPAAPDSISGATIRTGDFFTLLNRALAEGPVGYGPWRDGVYRAEEPGFVRGWKNTVDITVVSGYVVAAFWDALPEEEGARTKYQMSKDGEYGMVEQGGAIAPWYQQADIVARHFVKTQNLAAPDAISGATIARNTFFDLAAQALANARR